VVYQRLVVRDKAVGFGALGGGKYQVVLVVVVQGTLGAGQPHVGLVAAHHGRNLVEARKARPGRLVSRGSALGSQLTVVPAPIIPLEVGGDEIEKVFGRRDGTQQVNAGARQRAR
jgi:hypothetical protein